MGLYKQKDSSVWWMSFNYKGKQIRKSTETKNKRLADKIFAMCVTKVTEGKWFEKQEVEDKTYEEMVVKYLEEYSISKTESGKVRDKCIVQNLSPFFGGLLLKDITPPLIVDYKAKRRKENAKPATIERELCLLKRAFNLAIREWEWTEKNPVARVSRERFNNTIDRWLSYEEEYRLFEACPVWLLQIVVFALNTGMRQGEILDLRWTYVDLFRKTATIMQSKNGERRTIPLNQNALTVLKARAKVKHLKDVHVFASKVGTRKEKRNLARAFYQAMEKAQVEEFRFHDLRHTFATRLVHAGVDLYKVSKLLGHKDIRMTQRYAHHYPESLRDGVEVLDTVDAKSIMILS
jgi:integrase